MAMARRRFIFSTEADYALASEAEAVGAHIPAHGKTQKLFEEVVGKFLTSNEYLSMDKDDMPVPSWKTLRDRLKWIVEKRRAFLRTFVTQSGVESDDSELALMLDKIIADIDAKKAVDEEEQNKKTVLADALKKSGEETRARATRGREDIDDDESPRSKKSKAMFNFNDTSTKLADTI